MNQRTFNLLREMEGLGLIHVHPPVFQSAEKPAPENGSSNRWLRGCCKDLPEGSVNEFLERCRIDKDRERAAETREGAEPSRHV